MNGSELIWMRFDPTGFPGGVDVVEGEEPPQAASASVNAKMAHRAHPWKLNKTGLVIRCGVELLGLLPSSAELDAGATEFSGPEHDLSLPHFGFGQTRSPHHRNKLFSILAARE